MVDLYYQQTIPLDLVLLQLTFRDHKINCVYIKPPVEIMKHDQSVNKKLCHKGMEHRCGQKSMIFDLRLNNFYIYERETWVFVHNGVPYIVGCVMNYLSGIYAMHI